jgi:hypothetical protein
MDYISLVWLLTHKRVEKGLAIALTAGAKRELFAYHSLIIRSSLRVTC